MFKILILFFLSMNISIASILISSFDAFDGAAGNNSEVIAVNLVGELQLKFPAEEIKLCKLRTVYDKSFETLRTCLASMTKAPRLILSLGESGCKKLKIETRAFNWDYDYSSDNDGIHREGSLIDINGPQFLPTSLNWSAGYCSLSRRESNQIIIDNNAGTFVCNNLSYQMRSQFPELAFSFAHVPSYGCARQKNVIYAQKLLLKLVQTMYTAKKLNRSQPITKDDVKKLSSNSTCEGLFYKKLLRKY